MGVAPGVSTAKTDSGIGGEAGAVHVPSWPLGRQRGALAFVAVVVVLTPLAAVALWDPCRPLACILPFLVAASVIDARERRLPNLLTLPAIAIGGFAATTWGTPLDSLLGICLPFALVTVLELVRPGGFGYGDAKLLAAIGAAGGVQVVLLTMAMGFVTALVSGLVRPQWRRSGIPAGPALTLAAVVAAFLVRSPLLILFISQEYPHGR